MLIKIHRSYRDVIAICDSELLGKKFEQDNFNLDLTGEFFKGEEKPEHEIFEIITDLTKEDATFNIVGRKACELCLKAKVIEKSGIKTIQGVPIALALMW